MFIHYIYKSVKKSYIPSWGWYIVYIAFSLNTAIVFSCSQKMKILIPKFYKNSYIFGLVLAKHYNFLWPKSARTINKELKKDEFKSKYTEQCDMYGSSTIENLSTIFSVTLYIKYCERYSSTGSGNVIYLDIGENCYFHTVPYNFFYLPKGISKDRKIYTRLDEILNYFEIPVQISNVIWQTGLSELDPCPLKRQNLNQIEKKYNISILVWSKKETNKDHYEFHCIRSGGGGNNKKYEINLHWQKESKSYLLITNTKLYFKNFYTCKNLALGCHYQFSRIGKLRDHEKSCITPTEACENPTIKQKAFGRQSHPLEKALDLNLIKYLPSNENFIFFDIECCLPKVNTTVGQSFITHTHKLVSIAANSYINGQYNSRVWTVKDSSMESEEEIAKEFLDFCLGQKSIMLIDDNLSNGITKLYKILSEKNYDNIDISVEELHELQSSMKSYTELVVFGFNSSKYDLNILFKYLLKSVSDFDYKNKAVRVLKKNMKYFSIHMSGLHFKDLLNFSSPMTLDKYLKTWTNDQAKLVYPYEFFDSIENIRACKTFPPAEVFRTTLKGDIDMAIYDKCKLEFERRVALPVDNSEKWQSFECYLKYYNLSDVQPVSLAIVNQFTTFVKNFGFSPMQSYGLPSFARIAMYKNYSKTSPNIMTFPSNSDATKIFRQNIIGGLCSVYKRHCTLLDEPAAFSAKHNKLGKL